MLSFSPQIPGRLDDKQAGHSFSGVLYIGSSLSSAFLVLM